MERRGEKNPSVGRIKWPKHLRLSANEKVH